MEHKNDTTEATEEQAHKESISTEDTQNNAEDALHREIADLKDKLMRALAETENMRRRMEKERTDNAKYGVTPLAKALCPVADNLTRALQAIPEAMRNNEMCKNFIIGIEMIDKQFNDALASCQIEIIDPERGTPFSYDLHQAMSEIATSDIPHGTVAAVLQKGYVLRDRLIRPAMVSIAKKGSEENNSNAHVNKSV